MKLYTIAILALLLLFTSLFCISYYLYNRVEELDDDIQSYKENQRTIRMFETANILDRILPVEEEIKTLKEEIQEVRDRYRTYTFELTAYCPCEKCCGKTDGITYTGTLAKQGRTVAVDPEVIPLGSTVYINGIGCFIAEDIGGAIKGNRIDVYFDRHQDALKFGRVEAEVIVIPIMNID